MGTKGNKTNLHTGREEKRWPRPKGQVLHAPRLHDLRGTRPGSFWEPKQTQKEKKKGRNFNQVERQKKKRSHRSRGASSGRHHRKNASHRRDKPGDPTSRLRKKRKFRGGNGGTATPVKKMRKRHLVGGDQSDGQNASSHGRKKSGNHKTQEEIDSLTSKMKKTWGIRRNARGRTW